MIYWGQSLKRESESSDAQLVEQYSRKSYQKETGFHESDGLLLVVLLQIGRAIQYIALYFVIEASYSNLPPGLDVMRATNWHLLIIAFIDLGIARWCWTRRREAWGIAMGVGLLHLVFLDIWYPLLKAAIILLTVSEILLLLTPNVRNEFVVSTRPRREKREHVDTHHPVYWVVIVTQTIKAALVTIGGILLLPVYGFFEAPTHGSGVWILNIPFIPIALLMGGIGFVTAAGLYGRKKWAYDVTLSLAVIGVFEATVASSPLVFFISVCLGLLMLTPQAKTSLGRSHHSKGVIQNWWIAGITS